MQIMDTSPKLHLLLSIVNKLRILCPLTYKKEPIRQNIGPLVENIPPNRQKDIMPLSAPTLWTEAAKLSNISNLPLALNKQQGKQQRGEKDEWSRPAPRTLENLKGKIRTKT